MEEVGNFLGEVAQLAELAEAHLISAHQLLPPHVLSPASKMVCDFTPALRAGPNIAADAEAGTLIRGLCLLAHIGPPPVRPQRQLNRFTRNVCHVLPVVVLVVFIFVVDSCCTLKILWSVKVYYVLLLRITTLNSASHETRSFLPPSVRHQRAQRRISLVYIRAWSLHVNLVRSLGCFAAAIDQATPSHDLRCTVHHRVNLLAAEIKIVSVLLER